MKLLTTIILGAIIGWLASIIAKTSDQMGCIWNILIGIVGASLGAWVSSKVFHYTVTDNSLNWPWFLVSVGGAVLLILVLRTLGILRRNK